MQGLYVYAATLVVFGGADFVWLAFVAQGFYRSRIGHLMGDTFNLGGAVAFYLIYVLGLVMFAVQPAALAGGASKALWLGAAFGFFCYATYDLTNLATLRNWPWQLAVVDMAWGAALSGVAAAAGTWVAGRL